MRIDCHNDSALWLRAYSSLAEIPEAHFDFRRLREFLDLAVCAIFIHERKFAGQVSECFSELLDKLNADIAAAPGIALLLKRGQVAAAPRDKLILIGMEGAAPLGAQSALLDDFFARGLRLIGLTWNFANRYGGPGLLGGGLTREGRDLIRRCNQLGIVLDAAHSSSATFVGMLKWSADPVIDSHTVCGGVCARWPRAISDDQLRQLAAKGGVAGVTLVPDFLGGGSIDDVCRHIEHAVGLVGSAHVAIGSDFDGAELVRGIGGAQDLPRLYARLRERGMADRDVDNVAGESMRRLLLRVLPG